MHGGKKSRISMVDFVRFACAIGILLHHFFLFFWVDEANLGTQPRFRSGFIIVEIFLIIAGYFAAAHFKKKRTGPQTIESRFKASVKYTLNKFKGFMPYVVIAIIIGLTYNLISHDFNLKNVVSELEKLPQELLLGSGNSEYFSRGTHVGPLWYLSHLFFVFPIFCTLATSKKKYLRNWLYFVWISVYYTTQWTGSYVGTNGMVRIFVGLAAGQLLFDFVEYVKNKKIKTWVRVALQFVEIFCGYYLVSKMLCRGDIFRPVNRSFNTYNFVLAAWASLAIILAQKDYAHKINSRFLSYLGKISFPLYLFHAPIMLIFHHLTGGNLNFWLELVISTSISITFSAVVFQIITKKKK